MHVDREIRHAFVLGLIGIGACDEHAPVGEVRQGVPNFLSVDDPFVTVTYRTRSETSKV